MGGDSQNGRASGEARRQQFKVSKLALLPKCTDFSRKKEKVWRNDGSSNGLRTLLCKQVWSASQRSSMTASTALNHDILTRVFSSPKKKDCFLTRRIGDAKLKILPNKRRLILASFLLNHSEAELESKIYYSLHFYHVVGAEEDDKRCWRSRS